MKGEKNGYWALFYESGHPHFYTLHKKRSRATRTKVGSVGDKR